MAAVSATLGYRDRAFKWLDKAYQERDSGLDTMKYDPEFDSLHADPRFAEFVKKVGIPQ